MQVYFIELKVKSIKKDILLVKIFNNQDILNFIIGNPFVNRTTLKTLKALTYKFKTRLVQLGY